MSDFTAFDFLVNTGSQATPTWTDILGANQELRFHDTSTAGLTTASAAWPFMTRPTSGTAGVDYAYAYTADAVGLGVLGSAGAPTAFANASYLQGRWSWDNVGTFASAPILTAYPTTAHGSVSRGDGSLLGGHATDTGGTARSYLKSNAYGSGATTQVPAAAPGAVPAVTDGATGALTPGAGAWLANYQGLQGDNDWILYGSTPTATTAQVLYQMFRLFTGSNMLAGTHLPVLSCRYTYT